MSPLFLIGMDTSVKVGEPLHYKEQVLNQVYSAKRTSAWHQTLFISVNNQEADHGEQYLAVQPRCKAGGVH